MHSNRVSDDVKHASVETKSPETKKGQKSRAETVFAELIIYAKILFCKIKKSLMHSLGKWESLSKSFLATICWVFCDEYEFLESL